MNRPNCVVRFTKEHDEHGDYLLMLVKFLNGEVHEIEVDLPKDFFVIPMAQLVLGEPGKGTVLLNGSFQPQAEPTQYRTVEIGEVTYEYSAGEIGEVTYEYSAGEMGFTCKCGEYHAIDEDESTCACGRTYRVRHYLEVKENDQVA